MSNIFYIETVLIFIAAKDFCTRSIIVQNTKQNNQSSFVVKSQFCIYCYHNVAYKIFFFLNNNKLSNDPVNCYKFDTCDTSKEIRVKNKNIFEHMPFLSLVFLSN